MLWRMYHKFFGFEILVGTAGTEYCGGALNTASAGCLSSTEGTEGTEGTNTGSTGSMMSSITHLG